MSAVTAESRRKLAVLEGLHRALDAGLDGVSERQRNLFTYLVTEELEGRGERLKAYSIATQVLGRGADFDPQQDSIVRVEIGRLRQALERYYLTDGKDDPLVISIPKGQYRPVFAENEPVPAVATSPAPRRRWRPAMVAALLCVAGGLATAALWKNFAPAPAPTPVAARRGPVIAIAPFEMHADRDGMAFLAGGMQIDLVDILSEYQWLTVIPQGDDASPGLGGEVTVKPDFFIRASLRLIADQLATTVLLLDGRSGAVRWTQRYEMSFSAGDMRKMQSDLVARIGRDVGNPFGIVADIERAERAIDASRSNEAFTCQMRAFQYWRTFHSRDYAPAWSCFETLRERSGDDANTLALRALLTLDPLNLALTHRTVQQARADALVLAIRAHDINNFDLIPRAARYTTALCVGDLETFREMARATVARFPNNPVVLADAGARFLTNGADTQEGLALIARARAIVADLIPIDTVAVAVDALRRGDYEARPRLRKVAAQTDDAIVIAVELALAAARGDAAETARIRARLVEIGFPDRAAIANAIDAACWSKDLRDLVNDKISLAFRDARRK